MTNTVQRGIAEPNPTPVEEWRAVWINFKRALGGDIYADFNEWHWIRLLFISGVKCLLYRTNLTYVVKAIRDCTGHVSQIVPCFAISLVFLTILSYFFCLHQPIIVERWCNCGSKDEKTKEDCTSVINGDGQDCLWSTFHASVVIYLVTMILWNYTLTTFASPGIVLPPQLNDTSEMTETIAKTSEAKEPISSPFKRKSVETGGGCCFLKLNFNVEKERCRVLFYDGVGEEDWASMEGIVYIPSPQKSYCKKCKMNRPPRCHHCSSCNRCVLQMDHHCLWMNNCIGYNNYRSFVLTLGYLVVGCYYGVSIFALPFYKLIEDQVHEQGFRVMYKNKTGFLDLPMPWVILMEILETGTINPAVAIKIVFPLLAVTGVLLTILLRSHIMFICKAVTTLEYTATIDILKTEALQHLKERMNKNENTVGREVRVVNPFNQGIFCNLRQVFGPNLILTLLPIPVLPPKPYIPSCKEK